MLRRLTQHERHWVWERLQLRLTAFDGDPEPAARRTDVYEWDYGAFPGGFPDRLLVSAQYLPDETLLSAIKEGMERLDEPALYFVAKEGIQGDEEEGADWELPVAELTSQTLSNEFCGFSPRNERGPWEPAPGRG